MIFFLKITPFFETVINRKQTTNVYFFWFSAYHDSCSCSGTSICMSKMWRRIYSSPSARFSYEKVSIGTWYPFPVCVELPVLIFLVKTHEENNNKCHSPKKPVIGFTAHHQLDENVSISAWNPFPVCLCLTSGSDFSRQRARRKTNKLQIATPSRNLSSNPPQEVCALKQKKLERSF